MDKFLEEIKEFEQNNRFTKYEKKNRTTTPTYEEYEEVVFKSLAKFEIAYEDRYSLRSNNHMLTLYRSKKYQYYSDFENEIKKYTDQPVILEERGPNDPKPNIVKGICSY